MYNSHKHFFKIPKWPLLQFLLEIIFKKIAMPPIATILKHFHEFLNLKLQKIQNDFIATW
jgi:hypothetical protein